MYVVFAKVKFDHLERCFKYCRGTLPLPVLNVKRPVHVCNILAVPHHCKAVR
jgi:hypothetical protein